MGAGDRRATPLELMDKRRARRMLVVSQSTLDRLIDAGHIPVVKVGDRAVRISREALERFIAERTEVRSGRTR